MSNNSSVLEWIKQQNYNSPPCSTPTFSIWNIIGHNFLQCLQDICFKIFFVCNLEYPKESSKVWLFLQKIFYEIEHPNDKVDAELVYMNYK